MIRAVPNTNVSLPKGYESSSLRSPRDSDSPQKVWQRNNRTLIQNRSDSQAIDQLTRELSKLRRRILGGSGQSTEQWPPVLYDKSSGYAAGDWVWVKPDNTAVTSGAIDADTGLLSYAVPGLWRCTQSNSPTTIVVGITPTTAYHLPQLPYPTSDDVTASNVYWAFISGVSAC